MEIIREYVITGYRAYDGTVFETEEECVNYETRKNIIENRYESIPKFNAGEFFFTADLIGDSCSEVDVIYVENEETLNVINAYLDEATYNHEKIDSKCIGKYLMVMWSSDKEWACTITTDEYLKKVTESIRMAEDRREYNRQN